MSQVLISAVRARLEAYNVETPFRKGPPRVAHAAHKDVIAEHMKGVIDELGLDLGDDSLTDTPARIGKMYTQELFKGLNYANFPKCTTVENKFQYHEPIVIRDIEIKSVCEHHFMPIVGKAVISYIPGKKVLGLSKFARVADFFSSRPQVQERLTMQIGHALAAICETEDVYVSVQAEHMCMNFRGIEDPCSNTTTFYRTGKFQEIVL